MHPDPALPRRSPRRRWRAAVAAAFAATLVAATVPAGAAPAEPPGSPVTTAPRIVGGGVTPRSWPFFVALVRSNQADNYQAQFCGGSLVAPQWVLTAAHCTAGKTAADIEVLVGVSDLDNPPGPRLGVARIVDNPDYGVPVQYANDISLLELEQPLDGAPVVAMAGPGDAAAYTPGQPATLIGFGGITADQANQTYPRDLYEATMPVLSDAACTAAMAPFGDDGNLDFATMVCAGEVGAPPTPGIDACQGDSGGPLMVDQGGGSWLQIGIVSWGPTCGYSPSAYSRVSALRSWVDEVMAGDTPSNPNVTRIAGATRYDTAARVATSGPYQAPVPAVFVASGTGFADALASGPAAAKLGGPVLLTERDSLPAETRAALVALNPQQIFVAGGPNAVSSAVETELGQYGPVERLAGADRYATARVIVERAFPAGVGVGELYVASGATFPDALAGGAAAAAGGNPLVLTPPDRAPAGTEDLVTRLAPGRIVVLGGPGAVSETVVSSFEVLAPTERLAGDTRYDTASLVAQTVLVPGGELLVSTGENFPDALAAAPLRQPLGLVPTAGPVPSSLATLIGTVPPRSALIIGGTNAVSAAVEGELGQLITRTQPAG